VNGVLAQVAAWLNLLANALGRFLFAPIAYLPGWLSATLVAGVTGVLLLIAYKYTSNQRAIKGARDSIKANLLALKLFKDSPLVALRAQGGILAGALRLLLLSIVPMLVMALPVCLLLGQLSLWYQARPLRVGEEAVVMAHLRQVQSTSLPDVQLRPAGAAEVVVGPVRIESQRAVCWTIRGTQSGYHQLEFAAGGQQVDKQLAVGDQPMRISSLRPGWRWADVLLYPAERPLDESSLIDSIEIAYPATSSWTSGTDWWVIYWCLASMVAAFALRGSLGIHI
jgi:hypothetical protein